MAGDFQVITRLRKYNQQYYLYTNIEVNVIAQKNLSSTSTFKWWDYS